MFRDSRKRIFVLAMGLGAIGAGFVWPVKFGLSGDVAPGEPYFLQMALSTRVGSKYEGKEHFWPIPSASEAASYRPFSGKMYILNDLNDADIPFQPDVGLNGPIALDSEWMGLKKTIPSDSRVHTFKSTRKKPLVSYIPSAISYSGSIYYFLFNDYSTWTASMGQFEHKSYEFIPGISFRLSEKTDGSMPVLEFVVIYFYNIEYGLLAPDMPLGISSSNMEQRFAHEYSIVHIPIDRQGVYAIVLRQLADQPPNGRILRRYNSIPPRSMRTKPLVFIFEIEAEIETEDEEIGSELSKWKPEESSSARMGSR